MGEKPAGAADDQQDKLDGGNRDRLTPASDNRMSQQSWQILSASHQAAWFCAQVHYGQDKVAITDLTQPDSPRKRQWEAFCPEVYERRTTTDKAGRQRTRRVLVPMFPGYIFVRFDPINDPWLRIVSARGVARILGSSPERPTALPLDLIHAIADNATALNAEFLAHAQAKLVGHKLRVTKGPWAGFEGVCLWHSGDRVRLLMSLFGRETKLETVTGRVERL